MSRTVKSGNVRLSSGNTKMGRVLSVSLPPSKTCDSSFPCYSGGCYARKLERLRPSVRESWEANWKELMRDRDRFFRSVEEQVAAFEPGLFRWHVAGDIPDMDYAKRMASVAESLTGFRFLCFTKKYSLASKAFGGGRPPNLSVVVSAWPGLAVPEEAAGLFPVAYMRDRKNPDPNIPAGAAECHGGCSVCGLCWNMPAGGAVVFGKH